MTRNATLTLLLAVAVVAVCPGLRISGRAQASDAGVTGEFIAAALRDQEARCGVLDVEYTGVWSRDGSKDPADYEKANYRLLRSPLALRVDKHTTDGRFDEASYDRQSAEYRRLRGTGKEAGEGEISQGLMSPFCTPELLETSGYLLDGIPLREQILRGTVSEKTEEIDGHTCWRVDIPASRSDVEKYVVWVDQSIGFCPRRIVSMWKDMEPENVVFSNYAGLGDGVWFPKKQTLTYGSIAKKGATFTVVNTVTKLSRKQAVPKSDVILAFPSGAKVHDAKLDASYVVP